MWSVHVSVLLSNCKQSITSLSILVGTSVLNPTLIGHRLAIVDYHIITCMLTHIWTWSSNCCYISTCWHTWTLNSNIGTKHNFYAITSAWPRGWWWHLSLKGKCFNDPQGVKKMWVHQKLLISFIAYNHWAGWNLWKKKLWKVPFNGVQKRMKDS